MKKIELSEDETLVYSKKNGSTIRFQIVGGDLIVRVLDIEVVVFAEQWGFNIETESETS